MPIHSILTELRWGLHLNRIPELVPQVVGANAVGISLRKESLLRNNQWSRVSFPTTSISIRTLMNFSRKNVDA